MAVRWGKRFKRVANPVADESATPADKLGKLKKRRFSAHAWGMDSGFNHEMREFLKHDPTMRYAATTDKF